MWRLYHCNNSHKLRGVSVMDALVAALLKDRAAECERLRREVAAAKLALAEPAGESPPFIVLVGGMSVKSVVRDEATLTGRHWEAARMSKATAEFTLGFFQGAISPPRVVGWRAAVDKFIMVNSGLIGELERSL